MNVSEFSLPHGTVEAVVAEVSAYGLEDAETGGFFLADRVSSNVEIVALAGTAGIDRSWGMLRITALALDRLFGLADQQRLWIPAQFHSHRFEAFLSDVDVDHGLAVEGFVSAVVPHFSAPPTNTRAWGWWRFADCWEPVAPPQESAGHIRVIHFDENGIADA